jgi:predicted RNase H-like HicB family nuclease
MTGNDPDSKLELVLLVLIGGATMQLTAVFMQVPEGYVAFVEELPGANTQGDTLEEARQNLHEAVELVLEANRELAERSLAGQTVSREPFALTPS